MTVPTLFRNQSLKAKWMLASGVTIFVSYAISCIVLYVALHAWLIHEEEGKAIRTAEDLAAYFETQGVAMTVQQLQRNPGLMKAIIHQEQTVRILNVDGVELVRINDVAENIGLDAEAKRPSTRTEQLSDGTKVYVFEQTVFIGPFQGYLQLIHPLTSFERMMRYVWMTMLVLGAGALLLAAFMSYALVNRLIQPLESLRQSMRHVRDQGFEERVHLQAYSTDEIGDVVAMYNEMLDELEDAFHRQQQFVTDASHELRTPIQALEGHLSLIARWGKDDPDVLTESIDTALSEVTRMKKMMEELLQLARREQAVETFCQVAPVIQTAVQEMTIVYPLAQFEVTLSEQADVAVSAEALTHIVRNILENGIRYNERIPKLTIATAMQHSFYYIELKDNGIGIAEEHLPRLFDRFFRVDESRQQNGGTGLGLSIVKMLADKYNIELQVTSEIGKGTVFLLVIPLKKRK